MSSVIIVIKTYDIRHFAVLYVALHKSYRNNTLKPFSSLKNGTEPFPFIIYTSMKPSLYFFLGKVQQCI